MSLAATTRRVASLISTRGKFFATPVVRKTKGTEEKESSEEEKYAAKHDYELLMKWAEKQGEKMNTKTEEVKKEVKQQVEKAAKKSEDDITKLKGEVEELKQLLKKAMEKK